MTDSPSPCPFGTLADGRAATLHTLADGHGITVGITDYGARIVSLMVPDRNGTPADIVLGYGDASGYEADTAFIGGVVGRYANRIGGSAFLLDGVRHLLTANEGPNQLHGGREGFDRKLWQADPAPGGRSLRLTLTSPDGDEGFPGTLEASVTYRFDGPGRLAIDYEATTDKPTVVNLTQHSYFNLDGHAAGPALGHELTLHAERYLPVDSANLPLGAGVAVTGSAFDFRAPRRVVAAFDHNWIVADTFAPGRLLEAATLASPASGRRLTVFTDKPGLQFYTGQHLHGIKGKNGATYGPHQGFCLETQHFPDSPNRADFPSPVVRPGEIYKSTTIFALKAL